MLKRKIGSDGLKITEYQYNLENYGEAVPSYFSWITPDEQRIRAEDMEKMIKADVSNAGKAKDVDAGINNMGLQ